MVDTNIKTKAAMLHELESIKGLLLEQDDIPILQEVIEQQTQPAVESFTKAEEVSAKANARLIVEEQQDFFESHLSTPPQVPTKNHLPINESVYEKETAPAQRSAELDNELLDTIDELEKHTADVTANKIVNDVNKTNPARPSLAKATGENPFLPAHIRSRLHGNNPPPLFAQETAKKIAGSSVPSRLLGNTSLFTSPTKANPSQQDIIDSVIDKLMPEIEKELRARLESMSKNLLDELNK